MIGNSLERFYKRKVILLLDEYDTPMQEAPEPFEGGIDNIE